MAGKEIRGRPGERRLVLLGDHPPVLAVQAVSSRQQRRECQKSLVFLFNKS